MFNKLDLESWELGIVEKYPLVFTEKLPNGPEYRKSVPDELYVNLRYGFECGAGWSDIIETIAKRATEIVTELRTAGLSPSEAHIHSCIVKEKFASLRWQGDYELPEEQRKAWTEFVIGQELLSSTTCEMTGKAGKMRNKKNGKLSWMKTLCDEETIVQGYDL